MTAPRSRSVRVLSAVALAGAAAGTGGCGSGISLNDAIPTAEPPTGVEHAADQAARALSDAAKAGGRVLADATRPGGYPIALPGGGRVRVDLRACAAAAARHPQITADSIPPRGATEACATATRYLLAAASPISPQLAVAALTRTANAGGLDIQAALTQLESKEAR